MTTAESCAHWPRRATVRPVQPSRRKAHAGLRGRGAGFAMIEALIAILIFSLATLGLLGLEVSMTRAQSSAKYRADAAYLASGLIGTMWSDARVNLDSYSDAKCAGYDACKNWLAQVRDTLPGGTATSTVDAITGVVTLTIRWTVPNESQHAFVTTTSINTNPL